MRRQPNAGILRREILELGTGQADSSSLLRILRRIRAKYQIKQLLTEIVEHSAKASELVGHSYSHNNGFDKFVVDSLAEFGLKLRLHVWWGNSGAPPVHDHPWDFASSILLGQMTVGRYAERKCESGMYRRARYPTLADSADCRVVIEGTADLKCLGDEVLETGSFYCLCHGDLHSVVIANGATATMVLQGAHVANSTRVYGRAGEALREPFDVRYFTADEAIGKLERLRALLP
jgi:hypothetical protein